MGTDTKALLEQLLSRQLDWISAAEARVALLLPFETTMLGALFTARATNSTYHGLGHLAALSAMVALTYALACLAAASFPRLAGPRRSVIFFGEIARHDLAYFRESIRTLSDPDYLADLTGQVHRNADIARRKFKWVAQSLGAVFFAVLPALYGFATLVRLK
jgi:hypothetical protein